MNETNYSSIQTCVATGRNVAAKKIAAGESLDATASQYLSPGSSWRQRRAFDWGFLAQVAEHDQDLDTAVYAARRIDELVLEVAADQAVLFRP
jgi:hypothetical protein